MLFSLTIECCLKRVQQLIVNKKVLAPVSDGLTKQQDVLTVKRIELLCSRICLEFLLALKRFLFNKAYNLKQLA